MSLQVWLPLDGNLANQGLASVSVTNNGATIDASGKIGKCGFPIFKDIFSKKMECRESSEFKTARKGVLI